MNFKNVLITGGAGFVGSNLAILLRRTVPDLSVTALDNLKRRGSELSLSRLQKAGIRFCHGDIRAREDLEGLPPFDLIIDCSGEPSVLAGIEHSPRYVLETNLVGTINCLEAARTRGAAFLFLSTSRIYPIARLNALPYDETETRFHWREEPGMPGFSESGIAEDFPLHGARSFYGASKLAGEHLIQEYVYNYGLRALINRCGVLAGPWQMGRVDQGFVTLWVARHVFERPLSYIGFGGQGKQVRDILHVDDLFDLILLQIAAPERWDGRTYNVGGGNEGSISLRELTELCVAESGRSVPIASVPETSHVDLRIYVTDSRQARHHFDWRPTRSPARIVKDIRRWIEEHRETLKNTLA